MKHFPLFITLMLAACSAAAAPTTAPSGTQPAFALLSEPTADSRLLGRLYTVGDMRLLAPIVQVMVDGDNADRPAPNGSARITRDNLEHLLVTAKPVRPGDKQLDSWNYAPWCHATFVRDGQKWKVTLYLGGLGVISDDDGRRGAFRFDMPAKR